ncbi:MAG: hypothetical protein ACTSQF_02760 [Candidatus Heimdallarchaeaceae archaeon]
MSNSINEKEYKIKPFVDANIAEIQQPGKYRVVGKIVDMTEKSIVMDDGFGQLTITIPEEISLKLEDGDTIRAFGYVNIQPEKQMTTTFIQDFNEIDLDSYRQLNELEQSLRKANT